MKYTLHQLRKTFATISVNNRLRIYDAQIVLSHSDIKITQQFYALADINSKRNDMYKNIKFIEV